MGHRHGSDLVLLWLWRRLATVAPIRPLALDPPYAAGAALKRRAHTHTHTHKTTNNLIEKEIRFVVTRGGSGGREGLDGRVGGQSKCIISSYKINNV